MRGLQGPLMRARLQNASERSNRASILSLHSLLFRLGFVLTGPLVGGLADGQGLPVTFFVVGGLFAVILPVSGRVFVRHNASASG